MSGNKTVAEAFGIKTREPIDLAAACPVGQGSNVANDPDFEFDPQVVRRVLNNLRRQQPIWAWGPSGCGKTELFRQFAVRLNRNCHIISFGEETSLRELLGSFELVPGENGTTTRYRLGVLAKAIQDPAAIVVLDEMNMAPPGVTAQLNRLLEARELFIPETGARIEAAANVCIVATANTAGGIDNTGLYAGSQVQNGATRNRFAGLKLDYLPADKEAELIRNKVKTADGKTIDDLINLGSKPTSEVMVEVAGSCRSLIEDGKVGQPFSVRTLVNWAISSLTNGSVAIGFQDAYLDLLDPMESTAVVEVFGKITGIDAETGEPTAG